MNKPPDHLPEERWVGKPKEDYYYQERQNPRASLILLWLVVITLLAALGAVVAVAFMRPELVIAILPNNPAQTATSEWAAIQQTQQALQQRAAELQLTEQANGQVAIDLAATQAALDNRQDLLDQTETQSALNALATRTAVALSNEQQATRVALDYAATQAALNQIATQVELNYAATRAALDQAAESAAAGVPTQPPPASSLTPSPTAIAPNSTTAGTIDDSFPGGSISGGMWSFDPNDWTVSDDGVLTAGGPGGWLLTRRADFTDYTLEVWLTPLVDIEGFYHIIFSAVSDSDGIAARLYHNGQQVTTVGLYAFDTDLIQEDFMIPSNRLRAITTVAAATIDARELYMRVEVHGQQVNVIVNDGEIINTQLPVARSGAIGLEVPVGTRLNRLRITRAG
jgi:hypothetical protein